MRQNTLLIVLGPTASGKTKLAVELAAALGGEIISADSRQVYEGMDIGTGKDLEEYQYRGRPVPHHLIDIKKAGEQYNVNEFKDDFFKAYQEISSRGILPILCGGTGMYIHSLLQKQDFTSVPVDHALRARLTHCDIEQLRRLLAGFPEELVGHADHSSHKRLIRAIEIAEYLQNNPLKTEERPAFSPVVIGLTCAVEERRRRIAERFFSRLDSGLIEEVNGLLKKGIPRETLEFYGLEYKFVSRYLHNELTLEELKERLLIAINQFAKRQMTFFRKMEKDGVKIHWYDINKDRKEIKNSIIKIVDLYF